MYYLLIFAVLFIVELAYFRIADRFNIIDRPNHRSSHSQLTLRGGGIIFPVSMVLFCLLHRFPYPWFMLGLAGIAAISFADDIQERSKSLRLLIHFGAVGLLLYQARIFQLHWYWWIIAFIMVIGILNACNFMDGINGMTTAYAFTVLAALFVLNRQLHFFNENGILFLALANAVFAFFNFRKKARCFAGDVGSLSMAFCLLFFTTSLILYTGNILFILLFAVYGVDSVFTILHRIRKGENIFEAHRQHLYQYLVNEKKWPHLTVSAWYMLVQAMISVGVIFFWNKRLGVQLLFAATVLWVLTFTYIIAKRQILHQGNVNR